LLHSNLWPKFVSLLFDNKQLILFGDGSSSRDYTYVDDIVAGIIAASHWLTQQKAGCIEIFNLGGEHPISLKDLVKNIVTATGKTADMDWQPMQPGDVDTTFADLSKSKTRLEYMPQIRMQQGIELFVQCHLHKCNRGCCYRRRRE